MSCLPEPLFMNNGEIHPDFEWVQQGKGEATVWWDTATMRFEEGEPVVEGDISEEIRQQIISKAKQEDLIDSYYFVCGPGIQDNIYHFPEITFIKIGDMKVPFRDVRNLENISRFLYFQGYRGIVFWDKDRIEHNAGYITVDQINSMRRHHA